MNAAHVVVAITAISAGAYYGLVGYAIHKLVKPRFNNWGSGGSVSDWIPWIKKRPYYWPLLFYVFFVTIFNFSVSTFQSSKCLL